MHMLFHVILLFCSIVANMLAQEAPLILKKNPPPTLHDGIHPTQLDCQATGTEPITYNWLLPNHSIKNGAHNATLTLVEPVLAGVYRCWASNEFGADMSNEMRVETFASCHSTDARELVKGSEGGFHILSCPPTPSKICIPEMIQTDDNIYLVNSRSSAVLLALSSKTRNTYQCRNNHILNNSTVKLFTFRFSNPQFQASSSPHLVYQSADMVVEENSNVSLECIYFLNNRVAEPVKWEVTSGNISFVVRSSHPIGNKVASSCYLNINRIQLHQSGAYKCVLVDSSAEAKKGRVTMLTVRRFPSCGFNTSSIVVPHNHIVSFICDGVSPSPSFSPSLSKFTSSTSLTLSSSPPMFNPSDHETILSFSSPQPTAIDSSTAWHTEWYMNGVLIKDSIGKTRLDINCSFSSFVLTVNVNNGLRSMFHSVRVQVADTKLFDTTSASTSASTTTTLSTTSTSTKKSSTTHSTSIITESPQLRNLEIPTMPTKAVPSTIQSLPTIIPTKPAIAESYIIYIIIGVASVFFIILLVIVVWCAIYCKRKAKRKRKRDQVTKNISENVIDRQLNNYNEVIEFDLLNHGQPPEPQLPPPQNQQQPLLLANQPQNDDDSLSTRSSDSGISDPTQEPLMLFEDEPQYGNIGRRMNAANMENDDRSKSGSDQTIPDQNEQGYHVFDMVV